MPLPVGTVYILSESRHAPVILKSHAMKVYLERDGMTEEEALEHWSYNMEGTNSPAICVDDTLSQNEIASIIYEKDEVKAVEDPKELEELKETARIQGIDPESIW